MQALQNNFSPNIIQGWEPFRKWHHIQIGTSLPLRSSLHSATDQSKVLWGFWCLHEAACLWEASLYLLLSELGGHGQPLLDQTVHRGKQSAASDLSEGLLCLSSVFHLSFFCFFSFSLFTVNDSFLYFWSLRVYVLVSCCWQCANETHSLAPAARDPCCRLSPTSSTWPTAMTVLPLPWQRMSSRSRERERTVRPRRRWHIIHTHTHARTHHDVSRDMVFLII